MISDSRLISNLEKVLVWSNQAFFLVLNLYLALSRDAVNVVYVVGLLRPCAVLREIISWDHLEQCYSAIEKLSQSQ